MFILRQIYILCVIAELIAHSNITIYKMYIDEAGDTK